MVEVSGQPVDKDAKVKLLFSLEEISGCKAYQH